MSGMLVFERDELREEVKRLEAENEELKQKLKFVLEDIVKVNTTCEVLRLSILETINKGGN